MPYGFAQRVVLGTPEEVLRSARRAAADVGLVTGPVRDVRGYFRERYLPLADGTRTGRLWVWPIARGLSVVYLGLRDDRAAARLAGPSLSARLRRLAETIVDALGERPDASVPLAAAA